MTTTATIPQVRKYLEDYLLKHFNGTPTDEPRNVRLQIAIGELDDKHEGLLAMIEDAKQVKEVRGEV